MNIELFGQSLFQHRDGVLKISATIASVASAAELEDATLSLREMATIEKEVDGMRKKTKAAVDTSATEFLFNVNRERERLTALVNTYQRAEVKRLEERDRAARIVLESLARDASEARERAGKSGDEDDELNAELAEEEYELAKQTVGTQLIEPTNTPKGLGLRERFNYEITEPYLLLAQMPNFFIWKPKTEELKFSRAEFLKYLNSECRPGYPVPTNLIPHDDEEERVHDFGLRVFRESKTIVRTKISRADVGTDRSSGGESEPISGESE